MPSTAFARRISGMRRFNRFYTRIIGALDERHSRTPYSLAEARILYELAGRDGLTARDLTRELGLDPGYVSRIVAAFARQGLVVKSRLAVDGRRRPLALTRRGRAAFAPLDRGARDQMAALLHRLAERDQRELLKAMARIERLLSGNAAALSPVILRPPEPGDLGNVVSRQAALYAQEYGWDSDFEALIAGIVARYIERFDPAHEACWSAERDGAVPGSVFVVKKSKRVAQLRMLYVEPSARGIGLGRRLVEECVRFARRKGYKRLILWTNDILVAARRLYEAAGFRLVKSERHRSFGKKLVGQYWELAL